MKPRLPKPRTFKRVKQRWQDDYVIIDFLGNRHGQLHKTTARYFIAVDGTKYERQQTSEHPVYSIMRKAQLTN